MDIKSLRLFLGVLEHGSITKAAERLYIAQPALGLYIRKLEDELGVQLVSRHSRGVTATEAGLLLARHAEVLLRQFNRARQDLLDYAGSPRGRIAVGLTPTSSRMIAAELITRIREGYPDIVLNVTGALSEQLIEWLEAERIDIALTYNASGSDHLVFDPLVSESLYLVYPPAQIGTIGDSVTLAEALGHPLIIPSAPHLLRTLVDDCAKDAGREPKVLVEVDSVDTIRTMVHRGHGLTLLPLGAVRWDVDQGAVGASLVVEPEIRRTLHIAHSRRRPMSKAFECVRDALRAVVDEVTRTRSVGWRFHPSRAGREAAAAP
jgi:LysR family nitrogen assimilation transcriptional regulator